MYMLFPGGVSKAVTLSYDDGVIDDKRLVDIMLEHGLKGTFNLNSGRILPKKEWDTQLDISEALALYVPNGMEVAMHGINHGTLTEMSPAAKSFELVGDKARLEEIFGTFVVGGAYANSAYDDMSVEILRNAGIKYFRTTISTHGFDLPKDPLRLAATCHHGDPNLFELAEEFCEYDASKTIWWRRRPKLFYLWGHSFEFANNDNWDIIERFGKAVGKKSDTWYATNAQIFDYIDAYKNLRVSSNEKHFQNLSSETLYFGVEEKSYVLESGQALSI